MTRHEDSHKQEIQTLKRDIQGIGDRVYEVERQNNNISTCVQDHHSAIQYLLLRDEEHSSHIDDIENRNQRNNIRIRGLPESVQNKDLDSTLQRIFATILDSPPSESIELDRAHRSLGPLL